MAAGLPPGVESDVALFRVFNGPVRPFDEPAARAMLELALSRATDPAAAANHSQAVWRDDPGLRLAHRGTGFGRRCDRARRRWRNG